MPNVLVAPATLIGGKMRDRLTWSILSLTSEDSYLVNQAFLVEIILLSQKSRINTNNDRL